MEPEALAGMIFTIVVLAMIGGFVLLFPVSRQLGAYLRKRLESNDLEAASRLELLEVREALAAIEAQLRVLSEKQEFTERLLDAGATATLPGGTVDPARKGPGSETASTGGLSGDR